MSRWLLLFDIDGTLLDAGRLGRQAFTAAATRLFGEHFTFDGVAFGGGLDPLLFAEAAAQHQLTDAETHHPAFRAAYIAELEAALVGGAPQPRALPGALNLVHQLRARRDVVLGVLTGNYGESAALKLRAAGIDPEWFTVTAYGDEAPSRADLVALAMRRHGERHQVRLPPQRVVVIGDTPRDVACAREHGCIAFAVATGGFDRAALSAAGADVVVDSLADPSPLWDLLGASTAAR